MSVKEFGLGLATIAALSVPPAGSVTVEDGARGSFDGDVGARDGDEGAGPFFVAEGSGAFENDLVFFNLRDRTTSERTVETHLGSGLETG